MKIIHLDASYWIKVTDFLDAILAAIGAPADAMHPQALMEFMIWDHNPNVDFRPTTIAPPYIVRITNAKDCPVEVRDYIDMVQDFINWSRWEFRGSWGGDVDVSMETDTGARVVPEGFKALGRQFLSEAFAAHGSLAGVIVPAVGTLTAAHKEEVRSFVAELLNGKSPAAEMARVWRATPADIGPRSFADFPEFFAQLQSALE